ncbi:OsmC family protein [Psychroflexus sp. CAK57W]|uniref:OsmC family protein n=1 Tax=Psychroflexus curvus TaxID=2873595 RepID=UPI001CCD586A|nr:OsmC family protein [Psychroflexus curvus]MBZ9626970.1 OsmC family protein [Psychroflexus curvus]MBZ9786964.1 OsmC family protein [Psychroflexus curvus]
MSLSNFSINGSSINSTLYKGTSRQFNFLVDEPHELGGEDLAANPVEYLLAGYAGCLNVVINLVAKELGIKLYDFKININGNIDAAKFLGLSEEGRAGFQSLEVSIDFVTNATQESVDFLLKNVKQRCPVNDNLSNVTPIQYHISKSAYKEEAYA